MSTGSHLRDDLEDLLETLYSLVRDRGSVRREEISGPTPENAGRVEEMLRELSSLGLISIAADSTVIVLTPAGQSLARTLLHRHRILQDFLIEVLGIAPESAAGGAYRIKHVISDEILASMMTYTSAIRKARMPAVDAAPYRDESPVIPGWGHPMPDRLPGAQRHPDTAHPFRAARADHSTGGVHQ